MNMTQLSNAMADEFVNSSRKFHSFDVRHKDVVQCPRNRAGQSLYPSPVNDNQIGTDFLAVSRQTFDGFRQRQIHCGFVRMIAESMYVLKIAPFNFNQCVTVFMLKVHARNKYESFKTRL